MKWYDYIILRYGDYKWWLFSLFAVILAMTIINDHLGLAITIPLIIVWLILFFCFVIIWIISIFYQQKNLRKTKNTKGIRTKVVISRKYDLMQTTGRLVAFAGDQKLYECVTIELPYKDNQKEVSCIPEGVYDCEKIYSPTKGLCFIIENVPGRSSILIHKGNYAAGSKIDTAGCILPGRYFYDINKDGFVDVADSGKAMGRLLSLLPSKFKLYII